MNLTERAEALLLPSFNAIKQQHVHKSVHPYVPDEYADDPFYAPPTDKELKTAWKIKSASSDK